MALKCLDVVLAAFACVFCVGGAVVAGMALRGTWFATKEVAINGVGKVFGNLTFEELCLSGSMNSSIPLGKDEPIHICENLTETCNGTSFSFDMAEENPLCFCGHMGFYNKIALICADAAFAISFICIILSLFLCRKVMRFFAPIILVLLIIALVVGFFLLQNGVTNLNANFGKIFPQYKGFSEYVEFKMATNPILELVAAGLALCAVIAAGISGA